MLFLEMPDCEVGPWLASGNMDFRTGNSGSLCIHYFVQTIWFMLKTCCSSGSLEFWCLLGRGCLHDQHLLKTQVPSFSKELPRQTTLHTFCCEKDSGTSCVDSTGRVSGNLCQVSSGLWPLRCFPLLILLCIFSR